MYSFLFQLSTNIFNCFFIHSFIYLPHNQSFISSFPSFLIQPLIHPSSLNHHHLSQIPNSNEPLTKKTFIHSFIPSSNTKTFLYSVLDSTMRPSLPTIHHLRPLPSIVLHTIQSTHSLQRMKASTVLNLPSNHITLNISTSFYGIILYLQST